MYKYRTSVYILRWRPVLKTAFNVVFKEFITHIRNETSDKDLKAAIKQKVQEIRDRVTSIFQSSLLRT
jgi:hypothetical protein